MFRVSSYQAVLRVSLVSVGLLVCGAIAQGQSDAKSTDKTAQDTASPLHPDCSRCRASQAR